MVQLQAVRSAIASLADRPTVAVFVGASAGIGAAAAQSLAKIHAKDGDLRLYIVARNAEATKAVMADCQKICPGGQFRFVQATDLSLMNNVDAACAQIMDMEKQELKGLEAPKLDILVVSHACTPFQKRKVTREGLDFLMSLFYYSRMRFITQLLPLLLAANKPAHVISIATAGFEAKLQLDDLALLDDENYSYFNARSHCTYMKTVFFEHLARQHPGQLALTNVFPGLYKTPAFYSAENPLWFRGLWGLTSPLTGLVALSTDVVGDRMMYYATEVFAPYTGAADAAGNGAPPTGTDGKPGSGAYAVDDKGEPCKRAKGWSSVDKAALAKAGVEHTMQVFRQIETVDKFTG